MQSYKEANAKIELSVPLTIFESPIFEDRVKELFNSMEVEFNNRFNEIINFIREKRDESYSKKISYKDTFEFFKCYFLSQVLNESAKLVLTDIEKHDIIENIMFFLSEKHLKDAIFGMPMVKAFESSISILPSYSPRNTAYDTYLLYLLQEKFK